MKWTMRTTGLLLLQLITGCGEPSIGAGPAPASALHLATAAKALPGVFEASGVVHVPHSDSILFVDDNRPGHIAWMKLDSAGRPMGDVRLIPLGAEIADPEDITFDGEYFFVVSSQSAKKSGRKTGLLRFKFDAVNGRVSDVESMQGLRDLLIAGFPSLPELAQPGAKDGLNIEGLTWHPGESVLLFGLRSPRSGSDAVILRLKLRDSAAPLTAGNLEAAGPPMRVPLDGVGIRGLEYDAEADRLLIVSGPTEKQGDQPFAVWESSASGVRRLAYLDARLKPEGISRRGETLVIVCDAGAHLTLPATGLTSP